MYRTVDGASDISADDREHLKEIEMDIFKNVINEVEKQNGFDWSGTLEENVSADTKIAASIRSSFYNYEQGRKMSKGPQYFVFR